MFGAVRLTVGLQQRQRKTTLKSKMRPLLFFVRKKTITLVLLCMEKTLTQKVQDMFLTVKVS